MEKQQPIELRSEKVRNLIGQIPPALLRYGTALIALALLILCAISVFIPYRETVPVQITVEQANDTIYGSTFVPKDRVVLMQKNNRVIINDPLSGVIEATVSYISTVPAPDDGKLREVRIAFSLSSTASIQPDDILEGRIILSEMPVIKKFLQSVGISC